LQDKIEDTKEVIRAVNRRTAFQTED